MIADKNIYRDKDGNIVEEGDEKAAFLVAGKDTEIPKETIEKYGLGKQADKADEASEAEAAEPIAGGEKASSPANNKAKTPSKNKGAK